MRGSLQIKGSTLNSKVAFVRDRFGEDAAGQVESLLREETGGDVLDGSWYPFEVYLAVLQSIADRHYGGDPSSLFEIGVHSAHEALTGIYDFYQMLDFPQFLTRVSNLHGRFYSAGELSVEHEEGASRCAIRLHGAPPYSELDLYVAAGFYPGSARILGHPEIRCRFEDRGDEVLFQLDW